MPDFTHLLAKGEFCRAVPLRCISTCPSMIATHPSTSEQSPTNHTPPDTPQKNHRSRLAINFHTKLPKELQDMVYDYLNDSIEDIVITRGEARTGRLAYREWPMHLQRDHEFAYGAVEHYYRKTKFIIPDIDDTVRALELDVFGLNTCPLDYVYNVQVDIRLQHHTLKASKFANVSEKDNRDYLYEGILAKLRKFKELENASHARLHIRLTTFGARGVWFREAVRTMEKIRPVVLELREVGLIITVEHYPLLKDHTNFWGQEDLTGQFDLEDKEWKAVQKRRWALGAT